MASGSWKWTGPVGPRWLLLGGVGFDSSDDVPLAVCADIDGLFVDLPARPRERFTLVGCTPDGPLADLLARLPAGALGTERAWLGDVAITADARQPPWSGEDLGDVVVVAHRPSAAVPGTVDIDLDGFVVVYDRTDEVFRPGDLTGFVLSGHDGAGYGRCLDIVGVFRDRAAPLVPQVRLLGCQAAAALLPALDAVAQASTAGRASKAGQRRRRISAEVHAVTADGSTYRVIGATVSGTMRTVGVSRLGVDLLDVVVDSDPREPLPAGTLSVLERWHTGRPVEPNLWAGYDRDLRHRWAGVALTHHDQAPDRPPGTTYHLDGRFVTDIEGFYCAIGEAINGPGGYFGWNLDALDDCLRGRWGARTPFRLIWHHSAVARRHLVTGYDHRRLGPAVTVRYLLDLLAEHQVETHLR